MFRPHRDDVLFVAAAAAVAQLEQWDAANTREVFKLGLKQTNKPQSLAVIAKKTTKNKENKVQRRGTLLAMQTNTHTGPWS